MSDLMLKNKPLKWLYFRNERKLLKTVNLNRMKDITFVGMKQEKK